MKVRKPLKNKQKEIVREGSYVEDKEWREGKGWEGKAMRRRKGEENERKKSYKEF